MRNRKGFAPIILVIIIAAVLAAGGAAYYISRKSVLPQTSSNPSGNFLPLPQNPVPSASTSVGTSTAASTKVKIALLAMPAKDSDKLRMQGCDLVIMTEQTVPYTTMPLNAAMRQLFQRLQPWPYTENQSGNFISSQKNLYFDKAVLENGMAKIYLTGSVSLAGECDDPRLDIVIRNTALQFSSVKSVEIYVNGNLWMAPNEKGF